LESHEVALSYLWRDERRRAAVMTPTGMVTTELAELKADIEEVKTLLRMGSDYFLTEEQGPLVRIQSPRPSKPLRVNRLA